MRSLADSNKPSDAIGQDTKGLPEAAIVGCCKSLGKSFDSVLGGFGRAPKFPRPSELGVLLRQYLRVKVLEFIRVACLTNSM